MVSQNDSFRVFVDAYVRGAKVASVTPMAEGNYETVLELELGGDFFENLRNRVAFQSQSHSEPSHGATNLASRSAVGPGGSYSSNFYYSE